MAPPAGRTPGRDSGFGTDTRPVRLIGLGLVSALCLVIVVYLLTEVRAKLGELASSSTDNMQFALAQLEVEHLHFRLAIAEAMAAGAGDGPERLAQVRRRYDILYSRIDTLNDSPAYRPATRAERVADTFDHVATTIRAMVPSIDAGDAALARDLPRLDRTAQALQADIRSILTHGNQALVQDAVATRADIARVLYRLASATFVLMATLTLLVLVFRRLAITSRRRADALDAISTRLGTVVSTSRDAILVTDGAGRIELASSAAAGLFGRPPGALTGLRMADVLRLPEAPEGPGPGPAALAAACAGRTAPRLFALHGDGVGDGVGDGGRRPVELSFATSSGAETPVGVCVIRDVSRQVEAEAELRESRDRALAGERARARFLAVVSHEMRTPLNGILGALELVEENAAGRAGGALPGDASNTGTRPADERETGALLAIIRDSASILLELVNDVLDITEVERSGSRAATDMFDLDGLIDRVVASEAARARQGDTRLGRGPGAPVGPVRGDPQGLRRVLLNLVSNAIKFSPGGQVSVTARRLDPERVSIEVADTGMGIADDALSRIFDDFVRLDDATRLNIQGTGLGLGIVRQLVTRMNGRIGVESTPGRGSRFTVTLPLPAAAGAITDGRGIVDVASAGDPGTIGEPRSPETGDAASPVSAAAFEGPGARGPAGGSGEGPVWMARRSADGIPGGPDRANGDPSHEAESTGSGAAPEGFGAAAIHCEPNSVGSAQGVPAGARDALAGSSSLTPAETPPDSPDTAPPIPPPQDILVAEDNPTNRTILRRMLARDGHRMIEAIDGQAAVEMAAARRFDLILMDISMPRLDGAEAARRIRASPGPNSATRIVALTANVDPESGTPTGAPAFDDHASKPISGAMLRRIVARHATRAAATGPPG